jgi:4-aminobutyrate aminotransferase
MSNAELWRRREKAVPRGVASASPVFAERAENAEVWDVEGKRYIDFAGGIAVLNTGHRHPKVMKAVAEQEARVTHTAFQVMPYESYISLAEKLNDLAPIDDAKTIFFTTGAEAVENAVKLARFFTKRPGVVSFAGAFHGRSLLTMALTGKVVPYKAGFGPFPADIYHVPYPMAVHGVTEDDSFAALERLFKADVEPERIAAIIIEPVQGEGGFYIASPQFMQRLRALCDSHGILLISDEIQAGIGRTGKMFAIEHSGVKPDLMTVAKSLAGGFPLSGVIGRADVMDGPAPGGLGGTYSGNPVACAAGLAVLEVIEEEGLLERSTEIGRMAVDRLTALKQRNDVPRIGDIRNLGGMIAFEILDKDGNPDADTTRKLTQTALANGLILLSCGVYGNTIRILVPLTASDEIIGEGLDVVEKSIAALA